MAYNSNNGYQDEYQNASVYSPLSFITQDVSKPVRFEIGYFSNTMKLNITLGQTNPANPNAPIYNFQDRITAYVSPMKAKLLANGIRKMLEDSKIHNVCIESPKSMVKVSDGKEYNIDGYCISIVVLNRETNQLDFSKEVIYPFNKQYHFYTTNVDYKTQKFSKEFNDNMELETLVMALDKYYESSSYAIAASVNMVFRNKLNDFDKLLEKNGIYRARSSFNSRPSMFAGDGSGNNPLPFNTQSNDNAPEGFGQTSFEEIANSLTSSN